MIWNTWRRYRVRFSLLALSVLALIILMIYTERSFHNAVLVCQHTFDGKVIDHTRVTVHCDSAHPSSPIDTRLISAITGVEGHASFVADALALLPVFIGTIFGTSLIASELESQTNRVAWSQSVTRTRWLLTSWLSLAAPVVAMMSILAIVVQWWTTHIIASIFSGGGSGQNVPFLISGIDPIAFALFALSVGTFIGIFVHRWVSPYAVTSVGLFVAIGFRSAHYHYPLGIQYWGAQWAGVGFFVALTVLILALAVVVVRRWRA